MSDDVVGGVIGGIIILLVFVCLPVCFIGWVHLPGMCKKACKKEVPPVRAMRSYEDDALPPPLPLPAGIQQPPVTLPRPHPMTLLRPQTFEPLPQPMPTTIPQAVDPPPRYDEACGANSLLFHDRLLCIVLISMEML